MSKDIWHITNQDENTTDVPEEEGFVVLIGHWTSCLWYGGETPEPIFWENVKKWCYLDDLLALETELERTRKALDVATGFIKGISQTVINDCDNQYVVLGNFKKFAEDTLNQIKTALEQKD